LQILATHEGALLERVVAYKAALIQKVEEMDARVRSLA
jgi:phosphoribosylcarboxyaminoimidazole (NCAIR) mutase